MADQIPSRYMSPKQVRQFFGGVSDMFIRRRIADQNFPKPVKFTEGKFAPRFWLRSEVEAWSAEHERRAP